jgi:hypothetical protein
MKKLIKSTDLDKVEQASDDLRPLSSDYNDRIPNYEKESLEFVLNFVDDIINEARNEKED